MFKFMTTIAATLLLSGTAHCLQAELAPTSEPSTSPEELRIQQETFINNLNQKIECCLENLEQVDRTKMIVQSTPFAAMILQFQPVTSGVIAVQNVPLVAAQYERLMRKWNRHQLLRNYEESQTIQASGSVVTQD